MKTCVDCGGDVGRGWTNPSDHTLCASCDIARALGSPIPPRPPRVGDPITVDLLTRLKQLEAQQARRNDYKKRWNSAHKEQRRATWRAYSAKRRQDQKLAVLRAIQGGTDA